MTTAAKGLGSSLREVVNHNLYWILYRTLDDMLGVRLKERFNNGFGGKFGEGLYWKLDVRVETRLKEKLHEERIGQ